MTSTLPVTPTTATTAPRSGLPFGLVLGLLTGLALFATTRPTLRDVDLYWHIRAGRELLDGATPWTVGDTWSFAPLPDHWTTTQWLAEVALAALSSHWGWNAFVVLRCLTAAVTVAVLARTTLAGRPRALAGLPFAVAAAAAISVSQERPQQATLVGAAALGGVLLGGLRGRLPRWWLLLPATLLWANLHGGWVLVPAALGLVWAGRLLDRGLRDALAWAALGRAAAACLAGSLTPAGPAGLLSVLRFSGSTEVIQEWMPTAAMSDIGYLTVAMLVLVLVAWARPGRVPRSEVLAVLALLVFAWTAWRNVAPALLMLAPLVAARLVAAFPAVGSRPEPRWSAPLGVALAAGLLLAGLATVPGRDPLPRDRYPVELAARISALPEGQRVLNDYNVAGLVLALGGPTTRVGIDGRADRYGGEYIERYTDATALRGDWEALLDQLAPTSALLQADSPLAHVLVAERGWSRLADEGDWVLLTAATGAP